MQGADYVILNFVQPYSQESFNVFFLLLITWLYLAIQFSNIIICIELAYASYIMHNAYSEWNRALLLVLLITQELSNKFIIFINVEKDFYLDTVSLETRSFVFVAY